MFLMKEHVCKLIEDVKALIYSDSRPVTEYRMLQTDEKMEADLFGDTGEWKVMTSREVWGGHRAYFYFAAEIVIPEDWTGKKVVYELRTGREWDWDAINPQFLVYVNGERRMGLDVNHRELLLTENASGGEKFRILMSAFTGDHNFSLRLDSEIKAAEPEIEKYYYDLHVPYEVARLLRPDQAEYLLILKHLHASLNLLDLRKPYSSEFFESLRSAQGYLDEEFYGKCCGRGDARVYCVGHTHIDVAWLWTLRVTRDKAVRSFSTVLELMRQYPEYRFMSSQPQLYKYVKEQAPDLYEQIRERIAQGRWEAEGGMFVEADCNLASGEALVRQFLYGTRFFWQEFGVKCRVLWLPDVFGYSAALPQIMRKCGIRYFMTTKISWNERNKMPYDTFLWEGIDGTAVLTHFIPTRDYGAGAVEGGTETEHFTTYNGNLNASQVMGSWQRYSQKELNNGVLMAYGYGDGGGGTTREMLENQRRLSRGIPGCPQTVPSTVRGFFEKLEKEVAGKKELPRWVGELYLEYHRGTYTSMARNKRFNRRAEFACMNLELYSVLAGLTGSFSYPEKRLADIWEILLRNQFHDILPGSSIKEVYEDSREEYRTLFASAEELTKAALSALTLQIKGKKGAVVIFNPNSRSVPAPLLLSGEMVEKAGVGAAGRTLYLSSGSADLELQPVEEGFFAVAEDIPPKGYKTFEVTAGQAKTDSAEPGSTGTDSAEKNSIESTGTDNAETDREKAGQRTLRISRYGAETPYFLVELNEKGQFSRIYDRLAGRELLPEDACANVIMSYEDRPHNFDAWEINHYYKEKAWEVDDVSSIDVTETGPLRGCIRIERKYLDSVITQYLYFYRDLYQIDIRNEIDWRERQILLRSNIPVDIHANDATYEIQYGNVTRPTHFNTSWDEAKFEVCAHKWIDISEEGYGLSILNDCKYGCDIHHGIIGLTMLKSGVYPNPDADKEHHSFIWSLCPHEKGWREGKTVAKAYLLNNPYLPVVKDTDGGCLPEASSFARTDQENVVIEAVKRAEEDEAVIIRLYECYNRRSAVSLKLALPVRRAVLCNMLEEEERELECRGNSVAFEIRPYEIVTLKLEA